jgi:hypothetical protein
MNVPTIGGARGIFEIFIPGVFLLLNLSVVVYLFPFTDDETKRLIAAGAANPVLVLAVGIVFGYLIGILLRLFRTDLPDKWSAWWLRKFVPYALEHKGEFKLWATEEFPYIGWLGVSCRQYLPSEVQAFYDKVWANRRQAGHNKQFFNFCKVMICSADEKAAIEIYAAEAMTRYISGMFYALAFASVLIFVTIILHYIVFGQALTGLVIILAAYLFGIEEILRHFRFIRIKETETVFTASFRNRTIFEQSL